jgi:N-acylneuraminate cytidylyltransferase
MVGRIEVLAVVPARRGSKSISGKNIRPFAGHPLLAYSVAAGLQARQVSRVIVSTDDPAAAEVARRYGAEVPFLRPESLAQDDTPDLPLFEHALTWLDREEGYRPEVVVQLRPTSPMRPPDCVDAAIEILLAHPRADSVRGVVPAAQNPYKMWRMSDDGSLVPILRDGFAEPYNMPRQSLPQTYWQTGHIDAIRTTAILHKHSMSGEVIYPLLLDARYAVDIDTPRDWERAEWLLARGDLDVVRPGPKARPLPAQLDLVILDFDGVLTDDRVWVDGEGREEVAAHRGDGWGIARLMENGVQVVVLSSETNPVVAARCQKLRLPVIQGVLDKGEAVKRLLAERGVDPARTVYLGNDVNDLPCFPLVGCAVVVADAHPEALAQADVRLTRAGGRGAVRELADKILARGGRREAHA